MSKKIKLNPIERRIIQILIVQRGLLNKNELAQRARVSWNTAEKYITKLQNRGWIGQKKIGSITYFYARI